MILIVTSQSDYSSYRVIDWLVHYGVKYKQIDDSEVVDIVDIRISDEIVSFKFNIRDEIIDGNEITKIWYRRSSINFNRFRWKSEIESKFTDSINNHLNQEENVIKVYFWHFFRHRSLNSEIDTYLNKYVVLNACRKNGISIPESIVTSDKKSLISFKKKFEQIITKNGTQGIDMAYDKNIFSGFTTVVSEKDIDQLGDSFFPSFFQQMIDKAFEVRCFYIDGAYYSSAIFSQADDKTKVDFRNYNSQKPNRTPPYELPKKLKRNIKNLMGDLKLNCGSIDILVDTTGKHYLLEINPIGQFAQVSLTCNYNLEKKIAQYLTNNEKQKYLQ